MSGTLAGVGPGRMRAPREVRGLVPALAQTANPDVWVWEYDGPDGWRLSIATHGAPGSGALSLGGFRIAPLDRASAPGYDNAREAVGLAMGMEEKIRWSRLIGCAGPRARPHLAKLVGGKCVLLPSAGTRVGEPRDAELLAWAAAALNQFEHDAGVHPVTGQDLGHGTMSDGVTASLAFLHARFRGSVLADTSKPTGEGNWRLLRGLMAGLGGSVHGARVALVGVGNIGEHVRQRLVADGCELIAIESNAAKRTELEAAGIRCWAPDALLKFLAEPVQAVVVNARGGTLSRAACEVIAANPQLAIVCGSENLVMPDPTAADLLAAAQVIYAPTEFGGMMGYLTAVEEYLWLRTRVQSRIAPHEPVICFLNWLGTVAGP
ncbi:MAG: hypothetical protein HY275_17315 [Gemmatimonadetes bacterium]|nr:hypothetical protein [Gemmatimonadota bacterium]